MKKVGVMLWPERGLEDGKVYQDWTDSETGEYCYEYVEVEASETSDDEEEPDTLQDFEKFYDEQVFKDLDEAADDNKEINKV